MQGEIIYCGTSIIHANYTSLESEKFRFLWFSLFVVLITISDKSSSFNIFFFAAYNKINTSLKSLEANENRF